MLLENKWEDPTKKDYLSYQKRISARIVENCTGWTGPWKIMERFVYGIPLCETPTKYFKIIAKSSASLKASGPCLRNLSLGLFCSGISRIFTKE
jgi:hypothetical protein